MIAIITILKAQNSHLQIYRQKTHQDTTFLQIDLASLKKIQSNNFLLSTPLNISHFHSANIYIHT